MNESRKGEDYRDIPLLKGREVWLKKTVLGEDGKPVLDADGALRTDGIGQTFRGLAERLLAV